MIGEQDTHTLWTINSSHTLAMDRVSKNETSPGKSHDTSRDFSPVDAKTAASKIDVEQINMISQVVG